MGKAGNKTGLNDKNGKVEQIIRLHPDTLKQLPDHVLKVLFRSKVGSHGSFRSSKSSGRSSEDPIQWSEEEDHYDGFGGEDDYSDTDTFVGILIPETKLKEEVRETDGNDLNLLNGKDFEAVVFLPPPPEQFKDGQEDVFVLPPPPQFQDDGDEVPTLEVEHGQERSQTVSLKRSRDCLSDVDSVSERKKNKPPRCKQCWKKFQTPEALEKHLITHEPWMRPYQCSKCGGRFLTLTTVKRHIRMKHRHNATFTYSECKKPDDKDAGRNGMASCSGSVQGQNSKVDEDEIEILKERQRLEQMGYYDFLAREVMNSLVETVELLEMYSGYDGGDKKDEKHEELHVQRPPDITSSVVEITKKDVLCEEKRELVENEEEKSISIEDVNFREVNHTSVSQDDVGIGSEGEGRESESALLEQHHNQSYFIEEKNECEQEILEENQERHIPEAWKKAEEALALARKQNAELVKVKEAGELILVEKEETHPVNVKDDERVEDLKTEEAITLAKRQNEELLWMKEDRGVILVEKEETDPFKDERVEEDLQKAEEVLELAWRQNTELLRMKDLKEDVEADVEKNETMTLQKDERMVTFRNPSPPRRFRNEDKIRQRTFEDQGNHSLRSLTESEFLTRKTHLDQENSSVPNLRDVDELRQRTLAPGDPRNSSFNLYCRKNIKIRDRTFGDRDNDTIPPAIGNIEERRPRNSQDRRISATPPLLLDTEEIALTTPNLDDPRNFSVPHYMDTADLPTTTPGDPRKFLLPHFRDKADLPPRTPEDPRMFSVSHFRDKPDLPLRAPEDPRNFRGKADLPPRTPEDPRKFSIPQFRDKADLPPRTTQDPRIFRYEGETIPRAPTNREDNSIPPLLSKEDLRLGTPQDRINFSSLHPEKKYPKSPIPAHLRNKEKMKRIRPGSCGSLYTPPHRRKINESRSRGPHEGFPKSSTPQHFRETEEMKQRTASDNRDMLSTPPHPKEINESRSRDPDQDFLKSSSIPQNFREKEEFKQRTLAPGDPRRSSFFSCRKNDEIGRRTHVDLDNDTIPPAMGSIEERMPRNLQDRRIFATSPLLLDTERMTLTTPNLDDPRNFSVPHYMDTADLPPRTPGDPRKFLLPHFRDKADLPPRTPEDPRMFSVFHFRDKPDLPLRTPEDPKNFRDKADLPLRTPEDPRNFRDKADLSVRTPEDPRNFRDEADLPPRTPEDSIKFSIPQFREKSDLPPRTTQDPRIFRHEGEIIPRAPTNREDNSIPPLLSKEDLRLGTPQDRINFSSPLPEKKYPKSPIPAHLRNKEKMKRIRPGSRDRSSTPPHSRKNNESRSRSPNPDFPKNSSIPQHFRDKEETKQGTSDGLSSSIPPLFKDMEIKQRSQNDRKKFVIPPPARSIKIERLKSPERSRKHVPFRSSSSKSHRHYRNDHHRSKRDDDRRDDDEMVKVKVEVRRGWSQGRGGISYSRLSSSRHNPHPSDYRHKSQAPHSSGSGRYRSPESRRGMDRKSRSRSPSASAQRLNGGREKLSYICRVCSKVFNHPSPLKLHMKGHVDDSHSRRNDLPHHHHFMTR